MVTKPNPTPARRQHGTAGGDGAVAGRALATPVVAGDQARQGAWRGSPADWVAVLGFDPAGERERKDVARLDHRPAAP